MRLEDLDTPVPVIDLDRVEHNIRKLQTYCDEHGLRLRPHIKTHKLPALAYKQLAQGAVGITCQKVSEAEVMAAAGIEDILLSYNVIGKQKVEPLARLACQSRLSVALDNELALSTVAEASDLAQKSIAVLIEFESGNNRTGVQTPQEALELARKVGEHNYLAFEGLMTYPLGTLAAGFLAEAKPLFEHSGITIRTVSAGGTPNVWSAHEVEDVTELRVGTYIYHDRSIVGSGTAHFDECALHVHATVVSRPTDERAVIDAGSKTLSSDLVSPEYGQGYGHILEYPEAVITKLNEEHGIIDLSNCGAKPLLGERLRIVPNHVCVVTNLHDEVVVQRQGQVTGIWPVWARGKTR
ncbi:MAG: D-TA family PLP-dependent enzyme [Trueperaceae bacterium]|nr:MAG: D-TA family PLP-dependent enzyme [Trueperaceae bacterium]